MELVATRRLVVALYLGLFRYFPYPIDIFPYCNHSNSLYVLFCSIRKPRPEDQIQYMIVDKKDKRAKAHVNALFFRQLRELLRKCSHYLHSVTLDA